MSDGWDLRHLDLKCDEREHAKRRPSPMHPATEDRLGIIVSRGIVMAPAFVKAIAIKQAIQEIAQRVSRGELEPCPSCQEHGVPIGTERHYDAAGDRDTRDCETCHGWTVVTAPDGGTR